MPRNYRYFIMLGILSLVTVVVRTYALDLMEFKEDEVAALQGLEQILAAGELPRYGVISSLGIPQPPFFYYLMGPWFKLFSTPIGATWLIVLGSICAVTVMVWTATSMISPRAGVFMFAFTAAAPWLVIYGRKLWSQNLLPPFVSLLLIVSLRVARVRRSRTVIFLPILAAIVAGLHYSGVCTVIATVIFGLITYDRKTLNCPFLIVGIAVMAVMIAPYGSYLLNEGRDDVGLALTVGSVSPSSGATLSRSLIFTGQVLGSGGLEWLMGEAFSLSNPGLTTVTRIVSWLIVIGLWGIAVYYTFLIAVTMRYAPDKREVARSYAIPIASVLHLSTPLVVYSLARAPTFYHYFIISMPAGFLLLAYALNQIHGHGVSSGDRLVNPIRRQWSSLSAGVAPLLALLVFGSNLLWLVAQHSYLVKFGGASGEYGMAYRYQRALARVIKEHSGSNTKLEFLEFHKGPSGVYYLLDVMANSDIPPPVTPAQAISVRSILMRPERLALEPTEHRLGPYAYRIIKGDE